MADTPNLTLPLIAASQNQKHVTHNEALGKIDALIQLTVLDRNLSVPPVSPTEGDRYIVGPSATDTWTSHENDIAAYYDGGWNFFTPTEGWSVWVVDEDELLSYDGTAWGSFLANATLDLVGINTGQDTNNRLSVKSNSVLFSHDDVTPGTGNVDLKMNKSLVTNENSVDFQTNFTSKWRVGTFGNDNFIISNSNTGNQVFEINTTTDQFIVKSGNMLLDDAGASSNFFVSKNATGDDASFTFQSNFSTRALFGLLGNDDFSMKVTPDGSTFYTGIVIDKDTGDTGFAGLFGVASGPEFVDIASGVLTVTRSYCVPGTQGGGASDTIDTINGGSDGAFLALSGTFGKTITLSEAGNLKLTGSITLNNFDDTALFVKRGTDWLLLSSSNNG